jgi:broad specificity phosphatase PhoE
VTTLLLVRHAAHQWLGRGIPGRMPGVSLNERGRSQAQELARRLALTRIDALYCSPQQRARETIAPLAARLGRTVAIANEFDEIDFGEWTGKTFAQLEGWEAPGWRHWIDQRSHAAPPGGERFGEVARRAVAGVRRLARQHPGRTVLVVSHGDVIKAAVASGLGLSLDRLENFEVAPASLCVLAIEGHGSKVKAINEPLTGPLLPP